MVKLSDIKDIRVIRGEIDYDDKGNTIYGCTFHNKKGKVLYRQDTDKIVMENVIYRSEIDPSRILFKIDPLYNIQCEMLDTKIGTRILRCSKAHTLDEFEKEYGGI